jgi:hypothetical protein
MRALAKEFLMRKLFNDKSGREQVQVLSISILLGVRSTAGPFKNLQQLCEHPRPKKTKTLPERRSLKIQPSIKFNRWSQTTVPVRLSGVWLDRLGFNPQQPCKGYNNDQAAYY